MSAHILIRIHATSKPDGITLHISGERGRIIPEAVMVEPALQIPFLSGKAEVLHDAAHAGRCVAERLIRRAPLHGLVDVGRRGWRSQPVGVQEVHRVVARLHRADRRRAGAGLRVEIDVVRSRGARSVIVGQEVAVAVIAIDRCARSCADALLPPSHQVIGVARHFCRRGEGSRGQLVRPCASSGGSRDRSRSH